MDFESAERLFYRQNYTQMAEEQNRNRKTKRIPEEYLNLKRYKPEEAIVQIGNVEDQPEDPKIFDECFEAFIRFLNDWNKEHGEHMHLLDYAVHKDEATTRRKMVSKRSAAIQHFVWLASGLLTRTGRPAGPIPGKWRLTACAGSSGQTSAKNEESRWIVP